MVLQLVDSSSCVEAFSIVLELAPVLELATSEAIRNLKLVEVHRLAP